MSKEGRDEKGQFSIGNLFRKGVKSNGGLEPDYKDPFEMAEEIAKYLEYEDTLKRPDTYSGLGKGVYTLAGCAYFLGFASRQSMYDYEQKSPRFSYVIKRFKLFLVDWNEKKMYWGGTFPAAQLWLKNWGSYRDEIDQNLHHSVTEVKPNIIKGNTPPLEDKE